ncbi:hypothetical protein ENUP19_0218G0027 [Entamoeba nuttalli]|uniref:Uncharacterized protein n=1 Tax=Entamoeba nuttalli TaxID=412467 RepID=A0ABQ0DPI3_9EUKA
MSKYSTENKECFSVNILSKINGWDIIQEDKYIKHQNVLINKIICKHGNNEESCCLLIEINLTQQTI